MDASIQKTIKKLQDELKYHRRCYYELDRPVISDREYDALYDQYLNYQKEYPELQDEVGWLSNSATCRHQRKMLSLRSSKDLLTIIGIFANVNDTVSCEPKIDGLAIELVYRDSVLCAASTRGDGVVGEDVLANILKLYNLPSKINSSETIEIYGEVFITIEQFNLVNRMRIKDCQSPYSNPRNTAAGILRANSHQQLLQCLSFFPYTVIGSPATTQCEGFQWLAENGFDTLPELVKSHATTDDIYDYHTKMAELRTTLPFEIDGLVFKIENLAPRDAIGDNGIHPHWAMAFKFPSAFVYSRVIDAIFQVGKSGIIAPVAIIDPVKIGGREVTRASLANEANIRTKDIRINDVVAVEMANDVIPRIIEVSFDDRTGKEVPIIFPTHCPTCNHPLGRLNAHIVCTNTGCSSQILGRLCAAVSRKGFNIKGLGKAVINQLLEAELISDLSDVFKLDRPDTITTMKNLGMGDKTVDNFCREIMFARKVDFAKFLFSLGITDVSTATANKLAEYYGSLDNMIGEITVHGVVKLANTNSETLSHINTYFNESKNTAMINRMIAHGVAVKDHVFAAATKPIMITGTMSVDRESFIQLALRAGYRVGSSISKLTEFVVAGTSPSDAKIQKAQELGIPVITEQEFQQRIS